VRTPRLLPLAGVAIGGVLAIKALSGVAHLPDLVEGAKAFAEGVVPAKTSDLGKTPDGAAKPDPNAPVLPPGLSPKAAPLPGSPEAIALAANQQAQAQQAAPKLACPTSPTELARDAGLSPAELQVLQSLGARRGQLDQREQDLDVQGQLMSAAEAKLDAKLQALASMKAELQKLLSDGDAKRAAEIDNLVSVYSKMKPAAAAQRLSLLDDAVRLPIAAKMKPAVLSAILGQMPPADAKEITEKLAGRLENKVLADARQAISGQPPASSAPASAAPAQPAAQAANTPAPDKAAPAPKPAKVAKVKPKKKPKPAAELAANTATSPVKTPAAQPTPSATAPATAGSAPASASKPPAGAAAAPAAGKSG
jgi:flagellar motility protein MotE (MotC chaperone)